MRRNLNQVQQIRTCTSDDLSKLHLRHRIEVPEIWRKVHHSIEINDRMIRHAFRYPRYMLVGMAGNFSTSLSDDIFRLSRVAMVLAMGIGHFIEEWRNP